MVEHPARGRRNAKQPSLAAIQKVQSVWRSGQRKMARRSRCHRWTFIGQHHPLRNGLVTIEQARRRSTRATPRGPLHGGRSTRAAPRGSLHEGAADLFYTDVRSILMVLLAFKGASCHRHHRRYLHGPSALHAGRSTRAAPRGPLHQGVADIFYTDVRSILMVLLAFKGPR